MLAIAIDGACRRNGKPNCVSAAGVYIQQFDENRNFKQSKVLSNYELKSTNQRGELLALLTALDYIWSAKQETYIITDSEYLFNAMTKSWFNSWQHKGWVTATGEPVKNKDLWQAIAQLYTKCQDAGIEIIFYHIKGHCIPFGKVTANTLLTKDPTAQALSKEVCSKYDAVRETTKKDLLEQAQALSEKNNGFRLWQNDLKLFVVANVIADAVATKCVDAADALL